MKKLYLILLAMLVSIQMQAQFGVSASGYVRSTRLATSTGWYGAQTCVAPAYFNQTLMTISRQPSDFARLKVANQMTRGNMLSTAQVLQVMGLFDFSTTRYEFARTSFFSVTDPENYFQVGPMIGDPVLVSNLEQELGINLRPRMQQGHVCNDRCDHGHMHHGGGGRPGAQPAGFQGNYYTMVPMSEPDFCMLTRSIECKSFDSSRLQIAQQALRNRFVTSDQVRRLMMLMTFESTKLELAKYAFRYVVDPENFYIVNDAFTFESSIRDLDRAINR